MLNLKKWLAISLGVILFLLVVGPFLIPIPALKGLVPPETLADPDSNFVDVNGLNIHYKIQGEGEPAIVMLHGFGSSTYTWNAVQPTLAGHSLTVAFDRPAFGLTERPLEWGPNANPYSPEAQIEYTIGLMDTLEIDKAILVGNSAGGTVAMATALAYPERVKALVLVDAAIYSGGGAPGFVRPLLNTPQMQRIGPLIARRIQNWGRDFINSAWYDASKMPPGYMDKYTQPLQVENWDRALWELTRTSQTRNFEEDFEKLTLPVLVITGDNDTIVPTEQSLRLAEALPNAELVVIPNCGHVPQEECPEAWLAAIIPFIKVQ